MTFPAALPGSAINTLDLTGEIMGYDSQKLKDTTELASFHIEVLIASRCAAPHVPGAMKEGLAIATCKRVVSKSVHDTVYRRELVAESRRLACANSVHADLHFALSKMLFLAQTLDPNIIEGIPSEYHEGCDSENIAARQGYNILTEPLSSFVFGNDRPVKADAVPMEPGLDTRVLKDNPFRFQELAGFVGLGKLWSIAQNKNVGTDIESQMPKYTEILPTKTFWGEFSLSTEANLAVAAIGGTAIAGLMASGARDSPSVRAFSAAAAIGFNCSLLAALKFKNTKVSEFLSKAGAIGTASAVTVALGSTFDTMMLGKVNLNVLVMSTICAFNALVVIFGT